MNVIKKAKAVENSIHPVQQAKKVSKLKKFVPTAVSTKAARTVLVGQKNSPTILFVGGVVGVVATTVLACRATLKLESVLEQTQVNIEDAKRLHESGHKDYSSHDYHKDMTYLYVRTVVRVTKLYGPSIVLGSLSIAALAGSHNILNKRNAALTAAYAAVERSFADYRKRVVNEYGEDKDREFLFESETRTIVEETETGPQKKEVQHVKGVGNHSPYAKLFHDGNQNWQATPETNLMFIKLQQDYLNDRLKARGHVFLNEAYDLLGLDRTTPGAVVGWVWDGDGDNIIDFGVWRDENMDKFFDFMVGREGEILLDFNVDGTIYDKI